MTLPEFLTAYHTAVQDCHAAPPAAFPHVWPAGPLLRLRVPEMAPGGSTGPLLLDPVGLVWFARTGELRGVLSSLELGLRLGLEDGDVLDILEAADGKDRGSSIRQQLEFPFSPPGAARG